MENKPKFTIENPTSWAKEHDDEYDFASITDETKETKETIEPEILDLEAMYPISKTGSKENEVNHATYSASYKERLLFSTLDTLRILANIEIHQRHYGSNMIIIEGHRALRIKEDLYNLVDKYLSEIVEYNKINPEI